MEAAGPRGTQRHRLWGGLRTASPEPAAPDHASLHLVCGAAGAGKTTLARDLARQAQQEGWAVHRAAAVDVDGDPTLAIWQRLAAPLEARGLATPLGPLASTATPPPTTPAPAPLAAAQALLSAVSTPERHALIVLEDLHRADLASLALLEELAPTLSGQPITLLATLRATTAHPDPHGREALARLCAHHSVHALAPLTTAETAAAAREATGQPTDPGVVSWAERTASTLATHTGGDPLRLHGLLTALDVADGARPNADAIIGAHRAALADVLAQRVLPTLPTAARRVLALAAALGPRADLATLTAATEDPIEVALGPAEAAGLAHAEHGVLAFADAAAHDAATRLPLELEAHRRLAEALKDRGRPADLAAAADHLRRAGDDLAGHARDLGTRAAATARETGDWHAAARAQDVALGEAREVAAPGTVEPLLAAAEAHHRAGQPAQAWARAEAATDPRRQPTPGQLARAALLLVEHADLHPDRDRHAWLLEVAASELDVRDPLRVRVLAAQARLALSTALPGANPVGDVTAAAGWRVDPGRARPVAESARAAAHEPGIASVDPDATARAALAWREAHTDPAWLAQRRAATAEALAHAHDDRLRGHAHLAAALDALEGADRPACDADLAAARRLAYRTGDATLRWRVATVEAALLRAEGRLPEAQTASAQALEAGAQADQPGRDLVHLVQQALIELDADASGPALARLAEAGEQLAIPVPRAVGGLGLALQGWEAEARRTAGALAGHLVSDPHREAGWLQATSLVAETAATLGATDLAPALIDALAPYAAHLAPDPLVGATLTGCVARPLARLLALTGRHEEAEEAFALASERDQGAGLRFAAVHGRVDRLVAHRDRGHPPDPAEVTALVRAAERLGARTLQRRAASLTAPAPATLTARQRAVLAGLAANMTYRDIAEELGFARSTIRKDVLALYRALEVSSRDEALEAARHLGLLQGPGR